MSLYTYNLLSHLPAAAPQHELLAFQGRDGIRVAGTRSVLSPLPTHSPPVRILWEQTGLPAMATWRGVDLLHGTVNVVPLAFPGPTVVTVHDLSFLRFPEQFPAMKARYLRSAVALAVRKATHIVAVSEHTRRDLAELLHVPFARISVVYHGIAEIFRPLPAEERNAFLQTQLGGRPMVLHVGTLQPRKNIDVLIRAFAEVRRRLDLPHVLALVGAKGWMYEDLFALVRREGLTDHVHFAGYVPAVGLPLWYNSADLFAYPSAYEGFGLPVLEAMACGVPVVTSASSALGELAGDAAITVPPGSQEALQVALTRVLEDGPTRSDLRLKGLARAAGFSWKATALGTVAVYERVLAGSPS